MIFKYLEKGIPIDDDDFDEIYPEDIRPMAFTHFTPVEMAIKSAKFLVQKSGTKVLDIGSGAGKFCMIGSACTDGHFSGVAMLVMLAQVYRVHKTTDFMI